MKSLLCCFALCIGATIAQFMPQPMPMGAPMGMGGPGMGDQGMGGPGFGGMGFNPFTGPIQGRGMNMDQRNPQGNFNRDNNNLEQRGNSTGHANDKDGRKKPVEQPRSNTDQMLDSMGLHGIQDFYTALTGELARNPSAYQPSPGNGREGY